MTDNEKLLSYLIVSCGIDLEIYDDRSINKEIFNNFVYSDTIWSLKYTIKYTKLICKEIGVKENKKLLSYFIMREMITNNPLLTKTVYSTLKFNIDRLGIKDKEKIEALKIMQKYIKNEIIKIERRNSNEIDSKLYCLIDVLNSNIEELWYNIIRMEYRIKHIYGIKNNIQTVLIKLNKSKNTVEKIVRIRDSSIDEYDFINKEFKIVKNSLDCYKDRLISWKGIALNILDYDVIIKR